MANAVWSSHAATSTTARPAVPRVPHDRSHTRHGVCAPAQVPVRRHVHQAELSRRAIRPSGDMYSVNMRLPYAGPLPAPGRWATRKRSCSRSDERLFLWGAVTGRCRLHRRLLVLDRRRTNHRTHTGGASDEALTAPPGHVDSTGTWSKAALRGLADALGPVSTTASSPAHAAGHCPSRRRSTGC